MEIAPTVRTSFRSRGGTEVHGFLATPPGAPAGKPLSTVLLSHGGTPRSSTARSARAS